MVYRVNPSVDAVAAPPIAEARRWIAGRRFPSAKPLIDLAQGEPAYPPPAPLAAHLAEAVARPETARYTAIAGRADLRAALAADITAAYGAAVTAEHVCITAGCNQAFCLVAMALAGPGDEVLLPVPYYFNHRMWLDMLGIRAVGLPLRAEAGGVPAPADAAARITPRTRAIALVSPNNPTGAIYPAEVVEDFAALARRHDVALVIDETYRDFLPRDEPPHALFRRPDWTETFVHLYSFSKVFALTGYRVGAVVCGSKLLEAVVKALDCVTISAPHVGQLAALYGLRHLGAWRREKRAAMAARAAALREAFARNDLGYALVSAGAFFAYVRHPFADETSDALARRLAAEENLLCLPGTMFGPGQEAYLRLALANVEAERMAEVAARLAASECASPAPLSARERPRS